MSPRARTKLFLAACLGLSALPLSASAQEDGYSIRPGDKVTISVFTAGGEQVGVVTGERIVDRLGEIFLPYVGTVHASGLDQTSLREHLVTLFEVYYSQPVVNVKVELKVNVTGSVLRPGQYFLDPTATVIDAISAAGGAGAEYAVFAQNVNPSDQEHVRLVRDGVTTLFSVRPDNVTPETLRLRIRSGDWIHVPTRSRSRIRDEVTFWGGIISITTALVSLIILVGR